MADDNDPLTSSMWSSGWQDDGWQDNVDWWTCDPTSSPGNQRAWGPGVSSGDTWWDNDWAYSSAAGCDGTTHCQQAHRDRDHDMSQYNAAGITGHLYWYDAAWHQSLVDAAQAAQTAQTTAHSAPLMNELERMAAADVESKQNSRTLVDIEGLTMPTPPPGLRARHNKFIPEPDDLAGQELRRLRDKKNAREAIRKSKRAAEKRRFEEQWQQQQSQYCEQGSQQLQ